jgi:hypothetical protein
MPKPFGASRAIVVADKLVFTLTSTHFDRDSGNISGGREGLTLVGVVVLRAMSLVMMHPVSRISIPVLGGMHHMRY